MHRISGCTITTRRESLHKVLRHTVAHKRIKAYRIMSGLLGATSMYSTSSFINQTINVTHCNLDKSSPYSFFILIYSLVFLVGLILNGLVMKLYFCSSQTQVCSSLMIYLKNLAAADFLLCLSLPLRITNYATSSFTIHLIYCSFGASILYLNMYASILFMGYIAANRYLKIVHPSGTRVLQTKKAARVISLVTWGSLLVPTLTYSTVLTVSQKYDTSAPTHCGMLRHGPISLIYIMMRTMSTVIFLCVLISFIFFYYHISRKVLQAQQKKHSSSNTKILLKSRRNMLVLVSVFCVCFVPYHLFILPYIFFWKSCSVYQVVSYVMEFTTLLSVLNICLDPLVYFVFCKAFRDQLK
ncbi:P2Y purinoceptor 14-like [Pholidichthys leucotaenia]